LTPPPHLLGGEQMPGLWRAHKPREANALLWALLSLYIKGFDMKVRTLFLMALALLVLVSMFPVAAQEESDLNAKIEIIAESDDTITVRHEFGETEISKNPQRIVAVTGTSELEALLALEVLPVAAAGDDGDAGTTVWSSHLEPLLDGVEQLPSRRNVNLELVLAAQPDLIIGSASWLDEIYDDLSAIAPTVALDFSRPWQGTLRDVAILVNQVERGESVIAEYDARVEALVEQYRPEVEGITYSQIKSFISESEVQLYTSTNASPILDLLGMVQPDEQLEAAAADNGSTGISLERIDLFDTNVIFIFHYPGETEQAEIDALKANPLFASFDAVAEDRVFEVISSWWYLGGAIGAQVLLDDLEQTVLPALAGIDT
jgi:iron complex transport system substrate-binding protein